MFNPLMQDLSKLKNDDLENKITELMKKYHLAARFGQGTVCGQISVLLEAYREEQQRRYILAEQKLAKQNKNLDDFINVDH